MEDVTLYPRLALIRAQREKRYLSVPTPCLNVGTMQGDISLCAHNFRQ